MELRASSKERRISSRPAAPAVTEVVDLNSITRLFPNSNSERVEEEEGNEVLAAQARTATFFISSWLQIHDHIEKVFDMLPYQTPAIGEDLLPTLLQGLRRS